jgi:hypothetical protein
MSRHNNGCNELFEIILFIILLILLIFVVFGASYILSMELMSESGNMFIIVYMWILIALLMAPAVLLG